MKNKTVFKVGDLIRIPSKRVLNAKIKSISTNKELITTYDNGTFHKDHCVLLVSMHEEKPTAKGALRYNDGKLQWSLVHFKSLEPMVRVLEYGSKKYTVGEVSGADNWKKGLDKKEILESMMRHLTAIMDGEKTDSESGISHIGHIQCNCMFYDYFDNHDDSVESKA